MLFCSKDSISDANKVLRAGNAKLRQENLELKQKIEELRQEKYRLYACLRSLPKPLRTYLIKKTQLKNYGNGK